ncbi:MAG: zinc-ribbon domain-containing protein [Clostridia bacterium]|nr:zinc-ribbon domain-containing protein [Clostridia bacterium]
MVDQAFCGCCLFKPSGMANDSCVCIRQEATGGKNMFCQNCGKEISDQAKFCNYCGAPVNAARQQTASASREVPREKPVKKKGKAGSTIVTILVALVVYFGARAITENVLTNKDKPVSTPQQSQGVIEVTRDVTVDMSSCMYGGLYQDGVLQYGITKLTAPGYSLLPGEGDERDWLISEDSTCLLAAYKQNEVMGVSYDASTEASLLESFRNSYGSAEMIDYRKTEVDGFPVIRYIVAYTDSDVYLYEGGLIVFPSETTKETIRLAMFADIASGAADTDINRVLDTLQVSASFKLTYEDTQTMGLNRITVK